MSRMTLNEIALMRAIVKWRRATGVEFYLTRGGHGFAGRDGFMEWSLRIDGKRRVVTFERDDEARIGVTPDYHCISIEWVPAESVTQAVDLLVAYGYLPVRFSGIYRAGWEGAQQDGYLRTHGRNVISTGWNPESPATGAAS